MQLANLTAHPLGIAITVGPTQAPRTQTRITLTQPHTVLMTQPHQPLTGTNQQLTVGRKTHRLLLHRGVHRHPLQMRLSNRTAPPPSLNLLLQQPFTAVLANPRVILRQGTRVDRPFGLKMTLAIKLLPVRIFSQPLTICSSDACGGASNSAIPPRAEWVCRDSPHRHDTAPLKRSLFTEQSIRADNRTSLWFMLIWLSRRLRNSSVWSGFWGE